MLGLKYPGKQIEQPLSKNVAGDRMVIYLSQVWRYICIYGGYECKSFIVLVSSCSSWLGRAQQDAFCGNFISPIGHFQTAVCTFRKKDKQKNSLTYKLLIFTLVPILFLTRPHLTEFNRQLPFMLLFAGRHMCNPTVVVLPLPTVLRLCSFCQADTFIRKQVGRR